MAKVCVQNRFIAVHDQTDEHRAQFLGDRLGRLLEPPILIFLGQGFDVGLRFRGKTQEALERDDAVLPDAARLPPQVGP